MLNGKAVVKMERRGTAEARKMAEKHLAACDGFILLTFDRDEPAPIMNCGGVNRGEMAYMAWYLGTLAVSDDPDLEDVEA